MNATSAPYRFHAFEVSYFSAKVRPALRYKQLWVEELRADYGEIQRRTGLAFIPVVVTPDDETWQDTSEILEHLEARHPNPPLVPRSPVQRIASHLVELYADEFATIPAMHYRWGSELGEASARARFSAMTGSLEIGNAAADRMAAARIALGATDAAAPVIEAHTRDLLDALSAHFEAHPYLLGGRMSVADCALMGPLYGHLFTDLVPRRLLLETAVPVVGWIERCNFPNTDGQGVWLADDALAPGFRDVLAVMGRDAAPLILDVVRAFEAWADDRPADLEEPPRQVGVCDTALRRTSIQRRSLSYTLWMLQRTLDAYRALDPLARKPVDEALAGSGWEALLAYEPRHRLGKRHFQLVFEPSAQGETR
jgi:glutathione S-transferase